MLEIIKKVSKNKIFIAFVIIIAIMFPATIYKQSDKDTTVVINTIGIDSGSEDKYKVTILAVIPKGGQDIGSNLEVFDAEGENLPTALNNISLNMGKKIGLAHCDCIVLSEDLLQTNITTILDFFIRTKNLSTNPNILATPESANELLKCIKDGSNNLSLDLKNIITNQEDSSLLQNTTIDRFYRSYLTPNCTFAMPIIGLSKEQGGSSDSQQSEQSGSSSSQSEQSQGSSGEQGGKSKIDNKNEIAIIKFGKIVGKLSDEEKEIYSLLSISSSKQQFEVNDINDENLTNSKIIFEEVSKVILPICKYNDDGTPYMEYNIWLSVAVDQVISNDNRTYSSANGFENLITPLVEQKLQENIHKKLDKTIETFQTKHYDVMGLYAKFNAFTYKKFQKYLSSLDNPKEYMSKFSIKLNLHINFVI